MKKTLITTVALVAIAATPAFAATKSSRAKAHAAYTYMQNDPDLVIANNKVIGRDPDINVRLQMLRDASQSDY